MRRWPARDSDRGDWSRSRGPLREQRCIFPADAFYEWDRGHRPPQPCAIGPAEPGGLLALAGIWTQTKQGELTTAAILTTGPNRVMERLHHRMPVIVEHEDVQAWLAANTPPEEILPLSHRCEMMHSACGRLVRS